MFHRLRLELPILLVLPWEFWKKRKQRRKWNENGINDGKRKFFVSKKCEKQHFPAIVNLHITQITSWCVQCEDSSRWLCDYTNLHIKEISYCIQLPLFICIKWRIFKSFEKAHKTVSFRIHTMCCSFQCLSMVNIDASVEQNTNEKKTFFFSFLVLKFRCKVLKLLRSFCLWIDIYKEMI